MGKKKGKGKKKKAEDPFALTHLERETMHLQIERVGHKIRWRKKEMLEARGRAQRLLEEHASRVASRARAVELLERRLQSNLQQHVGASIPHMERQRWEAKARRLREVAAQILCFSRERRAHAQQAARVREGIGAEERWCAASAAAQIGAMEAQLAALGAAGEESSARRELFLRAEMTDLFAKRMEQHQVALRGSVDPINLKISEETRWYRDSEHLLRTERERLLRDTQARALLTDRAKESIARRKESTRAAGAELRELKGRSSELQGRNQELRSSVEAESTAEAECERLRALAEAEAERLRTGREELREAAHALAEKEAELRSLEAELERVGVAGRSLERRKERAEELVRAEMERSTLDMFDGPSRMLDEIVEMLERSARDVTDEMRT